MPTFRPVDADVGSVMTAYNRVNGMHMGDHRHLVGNVLKNEWGSMATPPPTLDDLAFLRHDPNFGWTAVTVGR